MTKEEKDPFPIFLKHSPLNFSVVFRYYENKIFAIEINNQAGQRGQKIESFDSLEIFHELKPSSIKITASQFFRETKH